MAANIFSPSIAAAVPMKPCHGPHRAEFERLAEHVMRAQLALGSAIPVVPQHCRPPALKALHSDDILHEECARAVNFRKDRRISRYTSLSHKTHFGGRWSFEVPLL
jgi:hypothetical protein